MKDDLLALAYVFSIRVTIFTLTLNTRNTQVNVHFGSFSAKLSSQSIVWAFTQGNECWDVIVLGFTNIQWVQNVQMSEKLFCS